MATPTHRLIALLQFHNDHDHLPAYIETITRQVDGILILDDGSEPGIPEAVRKHAKVLDVIRLHQGSSHHWDEPRNHRLLIQHARHHGAQWVVAVDADERLEYEFRRRVEPYLDKADETGIRAYSLKLRECWDSPQQFRADGIWGQKTRPRLFRPAYELQNVESRLHQSWAPPSSRKPKGGFESADLFLYHLGMLDEPLRRARYEKYKRLDPDNLWQKVNYDYLIDITNIEIRTAEPDRGFEPSKKPDKCPDEEIDSPQLSTTASGSSIE